MPGSYSHTTFQQLIDQVASELGDPTKIFYLDAELQKNILESLRLWNMLTGYYRATEYFNTTPGVAFYDLSTVLPSRARGITVRDVLSRVQYRLMDPFINDPIASTGISEMYTHADLVRAIEQCRNKFLAETESVVTQKAPILVGIGPGVVPLDDKTITIARALWKDTDGRFSTLNVSDESAATSFLPSWRQRSTTPQSFSIVRQAQLNLQLIPPPSTPGELHLYTVESGATLDTVANTAIGVIDDTAPAVVWGALEKLLLRDGIASAPALAAFASQMYQLWTAAANELPYVLGALINNRMVAPSTLRKLDTMHNGWEGQSQDIPTNVATLGEWVALQPVPDSVYSIGIQTVQTTPTPAVGDQLQLGREQLSAIIGWAKQISLFKKGQLREAVQCGQELFTQARVYNEGRIVRSTYLAEMYGLSADTPSGAPWTPLRTSTGNAQGDGVAEADPRDTSSTRQPRVTKRLGGR